MAKDRKRDPNKRSETRKKTQLLLYFLKGSKHLFVISVLMTTLSALADMLTPQIIRTAIDDIIGAASSGYALYVLALAVVAVAVVKVFAQYMFRVYNTKASETLVKTMRDSLFHHIERLPFSWHMKNATGDIIQRCTSDIETTRNFVSEQLTAVLRISVFLVLSIGFMISMNIPLTLIAMLPTPIIMWYSLVFHKKIGDGFRECDEFEGKLSAMAQENLTGVRVVRAFGREEYERVRFRKLNYFYTGLWEKMGRTMSRFWSVSDILSGVQILLVGAVGAVFCVHGRMTAGQYVAFLSYNGMMTWPIRQLGRTIAELSKAGVSVDRVRYIMESEEEKDVPGAVDADMTGDVVFDHVNFSYDNARETLKDITFTVKAGSTIGILGGTGSGKSTMMYLLDRLYDLPEGNGTISIGGTDIRKIRGEHLRRNIGIVLQEPFLFSRSLQENIGITREGTTLSEIREAARSACLDETVMDFSKGYDTFVGERGVTLSGGQKQRAAIARMLLQNAPIMIFDDSLSAVDTETDAKIRTELESRFGTATIFLISHRITTLSKADQIIVLEKGRIVEHGTPEELRNAGGIYSRINEIQSISGEEAAL